MKLRHLIIMIGCLLMTACSQTEDIIYPQSNQNTTRTTDATDISDYQSTLEQRIQIAQWFANNYTLEDAKRVHRAVTKSLSLGLDEVYYLKEYTSTNTANNKISDEEPTEKSIQLASLCNNESTSSIDIQSNNTISNGSVSTINVNDYLQIYWPYSEDWDGKTAPVIVYAPENINDLTATGYTAVTSRKLLVNEEYCKKRPVWIINESETAYSSLPNLAKGERISEDGTFYCPEISYANSSSINSTSANPVYLWEAQTIKVSKQYDSWLAGGSELEFQVAYPKLSGYVGGITKKTKYISRKDISDKKEIPLQGIIFNTNWRPEQITNYLYITESDGGKKKIDIPISLTYKDDNGLTVTASVTLSRMNNDDVIDQMEIDRDFMLRTTTMSFDSGNVIMKMPITVN